ncbi:AAA family ATPase [Mycolicibacterium cosmeticum]|uniref:LuxR family transcriptional regulator n=1 Tax=Mycolicibacterium cosmeticum TaxID=258533 RepID=W9BJD8_MYCCO|nr:AAA family ATPase [Mycolicibacterium cosmeticum]CDO07010.1 LuxR family transcriptional regulator [Mycolicibacterium cosmeticum]
MSEGPAARSAERQTIDDFLREAAHEPACLVFEGEAGIGKTTLWLSAVDEARTRGFHVLRAQPGQSESVLAYASTADLLADIEQAAFDRLPSLQRIALERILLRTEAVDAPADPRVVATAVLSLVEGLTADAPVLVAIDDVQWLDPSSKAVVAFIARRLRGRVGLVLTERMPCPTEATATWLRMGRPDGIERIVVPPLDFCGLRELFATKLGRAFPRPTMLRFAQVSGGNPYFALEMARTVAGTPPAGDVLLPATLAAAVRARIGQLDDDTHTMLLAAACADEPTVDLLARATGTTVARAVEVLEVPESRDIVAIRGNHVCFSHPLLAKGVYTDANPARRRAMHAALAKVENRPEVAARHLALACTTSDPVTLRALDEAADSAHARGDSTAAAELVEAAIRLGGETPVRRLRAGEFYFQAGDNARAGALIEPAVSLLTVGPQRAAARNLLAEIQVYEGRFTEAVELLRNSLCDAAGDHTVLVQTLLLLSLALVNTGEFDESSLQAQQAVLLAEELDCPALTSQALAMWVTVNCLCGHGVDEPSLVRALELEDPDADIPVHFRAGTNAALVLAWTGRVGEARSEMRDIRRRCIERGAESRTLFVSLHSALIEIWHGSFGDAAQIAEEAMERAEQLGGHQLLAIAHSIRLTVAAYTGRADEARAEADAALAAARHCSAPRMTERVTATLGFLEVSLGNYAEALAILDPLISGFGATACTEIITAAFLPDAVEAMVALGQLDEADPLITALETNGRRLDRPWMLAVGARCRSMWLAAHGDVGAADRMAHQAMREHDRLPMPFERARTELLVGQLLRRQRRKEGTSETLQAALHAFEELGAPLWAERARAELAKTRVTRAHDLGLTPAEQRVAELAASGMTNRDVAAALFISPKTVEHNLARAYRKLAIHSRAELGQRISQLQLDDSSENFSSANH